jgi:hypothetical protein
MKRFTFYLDGKVVDQVKIIAGSQKRSVSFIVSVLLQQAIREKIRKNKPAKDDNPQHNPGHPC